MQKNYKKPTLIAHRIQGGLPTVLSVTAVAAAVGAGAVAIGKAIGSDITNLKANKNSKNLNIWNI